LDDLRVCCPGAWGEAGAARVIDWLRSLLPEDRREIGTDLATVEFGWPIGMPLCRPVGGGLGEVRSILPSRRIARFLFFVHEGWIGVVHGFTKNKPENDLDLMRRRMKAMQT
jgi:phage-related protein